MAWGEGESILHSQSSILCTDENEHPTRVDVDHQFNKPTCTMTLAELQSLIETMYSRKDQARGVDGTFMWLMEEIGELAAALRDNSPKEELAAEFADVLAWLATIANVAGVDLEEAVRTKYGNGCPGCGRMVCVCCDSEKP
jgi:NTP pyrophosphatase (non-canonical NTP hydrolase)